MLKANLPIDVSGCQYLSTLKALFSSSIFFLNLHEGSDALVPCSRYFTKLHLENLIAKLNKDHQLAYPLFPLPYK